MTALSVESVVDRAITQLPYELAWYACDLKSGRISEDLRALKPTGTLSRKLGVATTTNFELALGGAPADWESATAPGASLLVAVDQATDTPIWAGVPLPRQGGSSPKLQLGAATLERYLDSRYPGTINLTGVDQAAVIAAVMNAPLTTYGPPFVLDAPDTGVLMDYAGLDSDDKSVLSVLQELMAAEGGPEWTIDVAWSDASHTGFVLPFRVRPAIGLQSPTPEGTFDFPGCVADYSLLESYEQGKGATDVLARGEGEGTSRLSSASIARPGFDTSGWCRWVYRFTPASGITDPDLLTAHAQKAVALMGYGSRVWSLQATASRAPRLGRDWALGDSVRIVVETSPRHRNGADVVARAYAWELDPGADKITPILVQED